ncbi:MAG: hypothetical protein ACSW71_04870, partial [Methanobrevibacter sp.]
IHSAGDLNISKSAFNANTARGDGGAIYNNRADTHILKSVFKSNSAEHGGAIHDFDSEITIGESQFTSNAANICGGAISLVKSDCVSNACTFTDNNPNDVHDCSD